MSIDEGSSETIMKNAADKENVYVSAINCTQSPIFIEVCTCACLTSFIKFIKKTLESVDQIRAQSLLSEISTNNNKGIVKI